MKIYSRTHRKMLYSLAAMAVSVADRRALALTPEVLRAGAPDETSSHIRLGVQTNAWPIDPSEFNTFLTALYAAPDPSLVSFLLDAGHAYRAGYNLPEFVQRHHTRLTVIHFRDYRDHGQVPLGTENHLSKRSQPPSKQATRRDGL